MTSKSRSLGIVGVALVVFVVTSLTACQTAEDASVAIDTRGRKPMLSRIR